jgi:hypothetical protein
MHQIHSMLAVEIAHDRMREAAAWRLADEVRRHRTRSGVSTRFPDRLRVLRDGLVRLAGGGRQPLRRPTMRPDTADCG